ncbi:deleted in malignant brain tumors 1 protein [Octopus bimaculoides]|uniref:SRCR domain-containing protein n=1 Tax=Octopus bimaculoides TaxID=37653 RepID=A0A0L8FJ99_OCTBM|nr:deleted in malignant brain tumors 1 protein [Octopus bimaculoides]|eukprot:XP_014789307.1 PREDICTED: deleted in malignant brain tumors 1 protein-like [Octopus bimaculoides]
MKKNICLLCTLLLFLFKRDNCQVTNVKIVPFETNGLNTIKGRVEIFHNNSWGSICDDGFDNTNAYVVCKSLNYKSGKILPAESYEVAKGKIWMDDVRCVGNEKTIFDCQYSPLGTHDCTHKQDVMISCTSAIDNQLTVCQNSSNLIRLNGATEGIGLVEVFMNGSWTSICDDYWDLNDAKVVCRQLCYDEKYALPSINTQYQPPPRYPIGITKLNCQGTESKITDCPYTANNDANCSQSEASAVSCIQQPNIVPEEPKTSIVCSHSDMTAIIFKNSNSTITSGTLSFAEACNYKQTSNDTTIAIKIPLGECGSASRVINSTHLLFTMTIFHKPVTKDIIVRSNTIRMTFQCAYKRKDDIIQNPWVVQTVAVTERSAGSFLFRLEFYKENSFTNVVTNFPMKVTLTTWLNVAITLVTSNLNLKLIVPACWVTTSQDKNSNPRYQLFENKCTLDRTVSFTPISQTMFGFRFQTFRFFNSYSPLYLHCSVFVCHSDIKNAECDRTCSLNKRNKREASQFEDGSSYKEEVVSNAFILSETQNDTEDISNVITSTVSISKEQSTYLNQQKVNPSSVLTKYITSQISTKSIPKHTTEASENFSTPTNLHSEILVNTRKKQLVTGKTESPVTLSTLQLNNGEIKKTLANNSLLTKNNPRTSKFISSCGSGVSNMIFFTFLITFLSQTL